MTLTKEDLAAIEGLFTGKFQGMEDHFGKIDKRLDGIDERLDGIDERLDGIDERLDGIDERLDGIDDRLDTLESTVSGINLRLEHVESDVESLKIGQLQLSERLNEVSVKVDATYELALENWGQIEESFTRLRTTSDTGSAIPSRFICKVRCSRATSTPMNFPTITSNSNIFPMT